jgi:DNA-directed RNA polymerase sigma subunit (sigma70/sigma32)
MSNEYLNNKNFEAIINAFQGAKRQKIRSEMMLADLVETYDRKQRIDINLVFEPWNERKEKYEVICVVYKQYQEQLAYAFYLLSENIANYARFSGIDIDDAIQEGVLICFEKIDRFDPRKGKAFNYMTTCILNHYRQIYRSIRNYNELKRRYHTHLQDKFDVLFFRNGKERLQNSQSCDYNSG